MTDQKDLKDYVKLVLDNMTEVSGANCFKISNKIALKNNDEGYDLEEFWSAYIDEALHRSVQSEGMERLRYLFHVRETSKRLQELRVSGINKKMLVDDWILSIRQEVRSLGTEQSA